MMDCEHVLDVEDMVLGRGASAELRRHVAGCASCQEAEAMFREEVALFAARRRPEPRRFSPPLKRWAALAVAAGIALVASALRSEERAAPEVLACMMPLDGMRSETPACMPREPVTFSRAAP